MALWPTIRHYRDAADRHRVDIRQSPDGRLFRHHALAWVDAAPEDEGAIGMGYWAERGMSGYFGSIEECGANARQMHDWINALGTTCDNERDMDGTDR